MSGKAILVLVVGIIIITATIMFNIEAASTRIVKNYTDYYMRQNTQNSAQSGVNLAITQLGKDRHWRAGFTNLALLDGIVNVEVYDTKFDSIPVIAVRSIAATDYGGGMKRRDSSIAYLFWSESQFPVNILGLLTVNGSTGVNGNIEIDGRNYDSTGALVPASGIPGVWSTSATFNPGGSYSLGGTGGGVDYPPARPYNPLSVLLGQPHPTGYPTTPDGVFGGAGSTFPEGTLKGIAKSGYAGSQYVTDGSQLKQPLTGVTYVETDQWIAGKVQGSGILIVHNKNRNAVMKNLDGTFKGIIISDDIVHLHGDVYGAIIGLASTYSGNVIGNGNAKIRFSRQWVTAATRFLESNSRPNILAWWE